MKNKVMPCRRYEILVRLSSLSMRSIVYDLHCMIYKFYLLIIYTMTDGWILYTYDKRSIMCVYDYTSYNLMQAYDLIMNKAPTYDKSLERLCKSH